ncbi:hypothetical protein INR49_013150, partial [Caranx melampygus]
MVDQITRLQLKLLEKRLENKRHNMDDRAESAQSARSYDGEMDALHRALRRKQDLLQRLREQHMLEDLNRPHTWGGSRRQHQSHFVAAPQPPPLLPSIPTHVHHPAPVLPILPPPPPAVPQPPRIIQQTLPQQPATIIQQLPQQQPLIAQIPPPHPYPAPRSGSIKEDMVELMLMQNAQMHQIIMHNMMLKAMPPIAFSQGKMSNQGGVLSIIIITMVLTLQHHFCPPSATPHGYQACHLTQQDNQENYPPYTMHQHLLHSHQSM